MALPHTFDGVDSETGLFLSCRRPRVATFRAESGDFFAAFATEIDSKVNVVMHVISLLVRAIKIDHECCDSYADDISKKPNRNIL